MQIKRVLQTSSGPPAKIWTHTYITGRENSSVQEENGKPTSAPLSLLEVWHKHDFVQNIISFDIATGNDWVCNKTELTVIYDP